MTIKHKYDSMIILRPKGQTQMVNLDIQNTKQIHNQQISKTNEKPLEYPGFTPKPESIK